MTWIIATMVFVIGFLLGFGSGFVFMVAVVIRLTEDMLKTFAAQLKTALKEQEATYMTDLEKYDYH